MKTTLFLLFTLVILLIASSLVFGQPGFPGGAEGPSQAPIDGGLGLLAAAGGAYAWKKLKDKNNQEDDLDI